MKLRQTLQDHQDSEPMSASDSGTVLSSRTYPDVQAEVDNSPRVIAQCKTLHSLRGSEQSAAPVPQANTLKAPTIATTQNAPIQFGGLLGRLGKATEIIGRHMHKPTMKQVASLGQQRGIKYESKRPVIHHGKKYESLKEVINETRKKSPKIDYLLNSQETREQRAGEYDERRLHRLGNQQSTYQEEGYQEEAESLGKKINEIKARGTEELTIRLGDRYYFDPRINLLEIACTREDRLGHELSHNETHKSGLFKSGTGKGKTASEFIAHQTQEIVANETGRREQLQSDWEGRTFQDQAATYYNKDGYAPLHPEDDEYQKLLEELGIKAPPPRKAKDK